MTASRRHRPHHCDHGPRIQASRRAGNLYVCGVTTSGATSTGTSLTSEDALVDCADRALDLEFVRSQFPAFDEPLNRDQSFFENAGGSFACRQTIDGLTDFYTRTKVQPYSEFATSAEAGEAMDRSRARWADALGVATREVVFGPSTSMNTYVLAQAIGSTLNPGDEVVVTNQDHEANTGAIRRAAERAGATLREWTTDAETGLLDIDRFAELLTERTVLVTVPHSSNIVGQENDIARITAMAHGVGARVIVDGVSFAPHSLPDVAALDADVYLFSLYKTYSVHQGLMVVRNGLARRAAQPEPLLQRRRRRQTTEPGRSRPRAGGRRRCRAGLRRAAPSSSRRRRIRRASRGHGERVAPVAGP